ncbi:MAG: hypothetical protein R3E53_00840 [Myxococcota bacterium]
MVAKEDDGARLAAALEMRMGIAGRQSVRPDGLDAFAARAVGQQVRHAMFAGQHEGGRGGHVAMTGAMAALVVEVQQEITGARIEVPAQHRDGVGDAIARLRLVGELLPFIAIEIGTGQRARHGLPPDDVARGTRRRSITRV